MNDHHARFAALVTGRVNVVLRVACPPLRDRPHSCQASRYSSGHGSPAWRNGAEIDASPPPALT